MSDTSKFFMTIGAVVAGVIIAGWVLAFGDDADIDLLKKSSAGYDT